MIITPRSMNRSPVFIPFCGLSLSVALLIFAACQTNDDVGTPASPASTTVTSGSGVPDVYKKIYGATDIYVEGSNIVIKTKGRPDHKSPYYKGTAWESTLYEAYTGTNKSFALNPNTIRELSLTFKLPLNPAVDAAHAATPAGPTGISLNGVVFFNQYAAMGAPLTNEVNRFDQYGGHPQMQGQYHYHVEPTYLTCAPGLSARWLPGIRAA